MHFSLLAVVLVCLLMSSPSAAAATAVAPLKKHHIWKKVHHFVFGYGSLICPESRSITNPGLAGKESLPVVIQDVERVWSARTSSGYTAMGYVRSLVGGCLIPSHLQFVFARCISLSWSSEFSNSQRHSSSSHSVRFKKGTECTGILIEVEQEEMADLDKREANYDRRPV